MLSDNPQNNCYVTDAQKTAVNAYLTLLEKASKENYSEDVCLQELEEIAKGIRGALSNVIY